MFNIDNYFRLAIPKKGRLYERTVDLLKKVDLDYTRKQRSDIAICKKYQIAILFLPVKDIPLYVNNNIVHAGITGWDVIQEAQVDIIECLALGFGGCSLSLLEPENNTIDLSLKQILKIATTFPHLTKSFFQKNYPHIETEIVNLSGSVEIACNLNLADMVVDLVDSGSTMRAAKLKVSEKILDSETTLITNKDNQNDELLSKIQQRIQGVLTAEKYAIIEYNIKRENLKEGLKHTPGSTSPSILALDAQEWVAVKAMLLKSDVYSVMDAISKAGAKDILIYYINNCRL